MVVLAATALPVRAARLDPNRAGRYAVGTTTLTLVDTARGRTLVTEVWYPADTAARDAPPRRGCFPLVLMAHGFGGSPLNYEYLTVHLAGWGFVVAGPTFPRANINTEPVRDLAFLGDLFHDPKGPADTFAAHVCPRSGIGLVGHSLGTVAALDAGRTDASVAAVVVLAPIGQIYDAGDFAGGRPAILVLAGTADTTTVFEPQAAHLFSVLPPPAALVKIIGGTHSGFTDVDGSLSATELARQQGVTIRYTLAFLKRYVAGDPRFGRFLTAADPPRYAADVELTPRLR